MSLHTYSSTASTAPPGNLSIQSVNDIVRAIERFPPEPLGQWMREQGFPPEDGGMLVLPESLRDELGLQFATPFYLRFSDLISQPVLLVRSAAIRGL